MQSRSMASDIDLPGPFRRSGGEYRELVGIEVECGLVGPESGQPVNYRGAGGVLDLLAAIVESSGGIPVAEIAQSIQRRPVGW